MKIPNSNSDLFFLGVKMRRLAHTPLYPWKNENNHSILYTLKDINSFNIDKHLQKCMEIGYQNKNISLMWSCWSIAKKANAKPKCLEMFTFGYCPLIGVHEICLRSFYSYSYYLFFVVTFFNFIKFNLIGKIF